MRALAPAVLGVVVAATPAPAQQVHRYDPEAEVTITGVVVDYHESKRRNDHPGLHFTLEIPPPPGAAAEEPGAAAREPDAVAEEPGAAAREPDAVAEEADVAPAEPGALAEEAVSETAGEEAGKPEPPPAPKPETVEVHACPVQLLSQLDFPIEKGDELTVMGSRPGNGPIVIAREIQKGVVKLKLRDEEGTPIWLP